MYLHKLIEAWEFNCCCSFRYLIISLFSQRATPQLTLQLISSIEISSKPFYIVCIFRQHKNVSKFIHTRENAFEHPEDAWKFQIQLVKKVSQTECVWLTFLLAPIMTIPLKAEGGSRKKKERKKEEKKKEKRGILFLLLTYA